MARPVRRGPWPAQPTASQRLALLLVIVAVIASAVVILATDGNTIAQDIAIGIISSFVASLVIYASTVLTEPDSARDAVRSLDRTVELLAGGSPILEHAREHGIRAAKPKIAYGQAEWISLLEEAQEELFIVGHALNKWCEGAVREPFVQHVTRLLRAGKPVSLVALPHDGQITKQLGEQRRKDYRDRIELTMETLAVVRDDVTDRQRANLIVHHLDEQVTMPYMVSGNERTLITAPYPAAEQESGRMLAITLDSNSEIGHAVRQDVQGLISKHSTPYPWQ